MILREEGIENVWARHRTLSSAVHAAVDCWATGGVLKANMDEPSGRSVAVTTIVAPGHDMSKLRAWTEHHAGLTLGLGPFFPSFSAIFNRKMQKLPLFRAF
jgi:alanine-glyoxylate transaminase/serine-glyoxylate transaminase/serine-pyruvate transaminase